LKLCTTVWANVLELDDDGNVLNAKYAENRAAQYIREYMTGERAELPFEAWECALY
jgi:ferredoxin